MNTIVITLPLPPRQLSSNARYHWRPKAIETRHYRADAYIATIAADGRDQRWQRAIAQATFYWPDNRRRDIRNAEHSLKAAYDGIVDAGLIVDDNAKILTHCATRFEVDRQRPRVVIVMRKVE